MSRPVKVLLAGTIALGIAVTDFMVRQVPRRIEQNAGEADHAE